MLSILGIAIEEGVKGMEFVIEELLSSSNLRLKERDRPKMLLLLKNTLKKGLDKVYPILHFVKRFFLNLTVKGELTVFMMMVMIITVSFITYDIGRIQWRKMQVTTLQQSLRESALEQQLLHQEALPIMHQAQRQWLAQKEENSRELFRLLAWLSIHFEQSLQLQSIQKKPSDPAFYLTGKAEDFAVIFQLETLLQSLKWQATITLLEKDVSQSFQLKIMPLHHLGFSE